MTIILTKEIAGPISVIDGHIYFEDHDIGVAYKVKVKQMQSHGAAYADEITEPSDEHMEIINMMLSTEHMQTHTFTRQQLFNHLKLNRNQRGIAIEVKTSPFGARISELKRKSILIDSREEGKTVYGLNVEYAKLVQETKKF